MRKTEVVNKVMDVVTDITCDSCGKSCRTECGFEYLNLSNEWGFCTNKDLQSWSAQICEECVDTKLSFINFNKIERRL